MTKTFVLGLGAQKAGTTWVREYLRVSDRFAGGLRKEYHVFDTLDVEQVRWRAARIREEARAELDQAGAGEATGGVALQVAAMVARPSLYFTFFCGLLAQDGVDVTGDFTPDHALLPTRRLRDIKRRFAVRGVRTVGVFVMRDPVERTVSAIRMRQRYNPGELPDDLAEAVLGWHADPAFSSRSDYAPTLAAIEGAFDPDEALVAFYEELFTPQTVERLCALTGLDPHPPDFEERSNASGGEASLPDDVRRVVARHHAHVYEAVAGATGRDVARLWPSASLL
ncbi:hypothetical protein GCM10023340_18750 [Nocardioides marinquilinus]|uniref:Sulfotransferase family protein n=1 Tax=Nocardioides marinquilinus TaxID=1210400 RepID=A0ABP9PPP1_9ACTN